MKKINDKQRIIMRIFGTFLFALALILILDLVFNGSKTKIDRKYVGTWVIGYKFYSGETDENLLYTFVQELHLEKDGTFYTKEITEPNNGNDNYVSGTFEEIDGKLVLNYTQSGTKKTNTVIFKNDKLCTSISCNRYYTKNKVSKYFDMYNSTVTTSEE